VLVDHRDGRAHVVPVGELDLETAGGLAESLEALRRSGADDIVLDLSRLRFMDCCGLRLILATNERAGRDGHRFALIPAPPAVQRLFDLTSTAALLPFVGP
jgi:anti-anti-sigma factor